MNVIESRVINSNVINCNEWIWAGNGQGAMLKEIMDELKLHGDKDLLSQSLKDRLPTTFSVKLGRLGFSSGQLWTPFGES